MLIIVNSAFDEQHKNSDDEDDDDDDHDQMVHLGEEIEMALLNSISQHQLHSIHIDNNSSCNEMNESTNDTEDMDTSDNNTTANTQTTAECDDDKSLLPINGDDKPTSKMECSSGNEDDDSNSKENYDMNDDAEDSYGDQIKRGKHDAYDANDIQCIDETEQLVNGDNGDFDECDYYAQNGDSNHGVDGLLKLNHNGDGIIANHFIGLYFA